MTDERTPAQGDWEGAIEEYDAAARAFFMADSDDERNNMDALASEYTAALARLRALRPAARAVGVTQPVTTWGIMAAEVADNPDAFSRDAMCGLISKLAAENARLSAAPPAQEATTEVVERAKALVRRLTGSADVMVSHPGWVDIISSWMAEQR